MGSASDDQLAEAAFANATKGKSNWWRANCPFCPIKLGKTDRRWSFSILVGEWVYHCFRCGTVGKLKGPPSGAAGITIDEVDETPVKIVAPEHFMWLGEDPGDTAMVTEDPRQYLYARGVPQETIRQARVGCCLDGEFAGRIIVPLIDDDEIWQGWVGRYWHDRKVPLRYRYPEGMKRGDLLFNSNALRLVSRKPVYVVEGVFDALPHWPNAVACLGKPTAPQKEMLLHAARPIVVVLDGDAWLEGRALAWWLKRKGKDSYFIKLPAATDPGNLPPADLDRLAEFTMQSDRARRN